MGDIYQNLTPAGHTAYDADRFVICDEYAKKRYSGKKTGMPVLYWKADTSKTIQNSDSSTDPDIDGDGIATNDDIYRYDDNSGMLELLTAEQTDIPERLTDPVKWDDYINNENVTSAVPGFMRPYRATSYILVSAGKDGYYGTSDDITNFDKTEE